MAYALASILSATGTQVSAPPRHETKFSFPRAYAPLALEWLRHSCAEDPRFPANGIHSLYFDTPHLESLAEKENSEYLKRKVRIRWYTDPSGANPGDRAHLEVKAKEGARSWKRRIPLPCKVERLCMDPLGAAAALNLHEWSADAACPMHDLYPACVISYVRHRFIEMSTGSRIALDTEIHPSHLNPALFRARTGTVPNVCILEVKGPDAGGLPPTLLPLCRFGLRRASFSKYAECLNQ